MAKNNNTLVFNGLMRGMSWDQIKEAKEEIQRHQGEKQPTKKDILTDWIIGKDYMLQQYGKQYEEGGITQEEKDLQQYNENNNFSNALTSYLPGLAQPLGTAVGQLTNSISGDSGLEGNKDELYAYGNSASDPIKRFIGDIGGGEGKDVLEDYDNRILENQRTFNIGDNASIAADLDAYYKTKVGKLAYLDEENWGQRILDNLNASGQGALQGSRFGPWGALFGGIAGGLFNIGSQFMEGNRRNKINSKILQFNNTLDQNDEKAAYAIDASGGLQALKQRYKMYDCGGKLKKSHKFAEGGLLNTYDYGLEEVNAGGSHEENPNEGVVVSYAPDGLPNKVEEGETIHNDYVYSKRLEANEKVLENNLLDKKYEGKSFADISKKLTEDRKQRPNDPISVRTNEENLNRLQEAQEELKLDNKTREVKRFLGSLNSDQLNALQQEMMDEYEAYAEQLAQQQEQEDQAYQEEQAAQEGMFGKGGHLKQGIYGNSFLWNDEYIPEDENIYYGKQGPIIINDNFAYELQTPKYNSSTNPEYIEPVSYGTFIEESSKSKEKSKDKAKETSYSSLAPLRFAEAFGSAGQYLSDILGLTNQPDYSNARMYQRAIDNIGGVNFTPIGDYLTYTPIDTEYLSNQQMATAAARRNYGNVAGNYTLGLLGDYNTLNQIGATAIAARQQDQEQRNKVAEFNRTTNAKNSEMSLDAQKQNATLRAQRAQEYRYLADMMTKERVDNEAARAANYQTFMSNVAAIGREDYNYDFIRWAAQNGLLKPGALKNYPGLFGYLS